MTFEKPGLRHGGHVSTLVAQVSADHLRAALPARAAIVLRQGRSTAPACFNSHDSDALLVTRYPLPTSRPSFPLRGIPHFHIESTALSCVECDIEIHVLAYLFPRRAAERLFFLCEQFSSRACVRKSFNLCAHVYTCVHCAAGAPRWRSATLEHCCLHEISSNFEHTF